jgi:phage gp16-like protein
VAPGERFRPEETPYPGGNMSPAKSQTDTRRDDLAKIHIAKKNLGLSDDVYREMLFNIAGVESAKDLDEKGRKKILKHLSACGFRSYHKSAKASGMHLPAAHDKQLYLSKIGVILANIDKPWNYADGIAQRTYKVNFVRWLKPDQLYKVMQIFIIYQKNLK